MQRKRAFGRKYVWLTLVLLVSVGGVGAWQLLTVKADRPTYISASVDRGDIVSQVTAQGTLAAVTTVDVGSQVSGTIEKLYADFNSEVKQGQQLAQLNQDLFLADLHQQEANVSTAEATLFDDKAAIATAQADLEKAKVEVLNNQHKFARQKELYDQQLISQDDYDTAQAALDSAVADQSAAESQLESARAKYKEDEARLQQARGALETSKVNLEHTVITSPISGTVINRAVDVGQTVAASYSAPVIFSIGQDLTKMQVNTNIDEADVGDLKTGMKATFTVDAYPGRTFEGTISQIRLSATTVNNVVTYDAVISVPNPDLALKPGMTANVKVVVDKAEGALKVPNSALRFKPNMPVPQLETLFKQVGEERLWGSYKTSIEPPPAEVPANVRPGAGASRSAGPSQRNTGLAPKITLRGKWVPIWILGTDMNLRPIGVQLGITDGVSTQIAHGNLKQGDRIIVGYEFDPNRPAPFTSSRPPGIGGMMGPFRR